jgi:hypothetical protein
MFWRLGECIIWWELEIEQRWREEEQFEEKKKEQEFENLLDFILKNIWDSNIVREDIRS